MGLDKINKTRIVVTIQKQLKDKLEIQAEKEHRSLANLVNKVMIEYLDKIEDAK